MSIAATCSSAFVKAAVRQALAGTALPWSSWSIVLIAESAINDGARLSQLTQILDAKPASSWTVREYQEEVEYQPGPPEVPYQPELLPIAYLTSVPTWTNSTGDPVTFAAVAIVCGDDVLMWEVLDAPVTLDPDGQWVPPSGFSFCVAELTDAKSTSAQMLFETANHGLAGKPMAAGTNPTRGRWKDFKDQSLGPRFKRAGEMIERLAYAIWGSAPKSYSPFKQWNHRRHPRCFWQAEQWRKVWTGAMGPYPDMPKCQSFTRLFHETAAMGDNESQPAPTVPRRSRSGDWRLQMLDSSRVHDPMLCPYGSVERDTGTQTDHKGHPLFDPIGYGSFGGDPALIGLDGDHQVVGEDVGIRYTPPVEVADQIDAVYLHFTTVGSPQTRTMIWAGGTWSGQIEGDEHNAPCAWYLEIRHTPPGESQRVRYEPGGESPPSNPYTFRFYYHWSPYPHGIPELWDFCAKGTDRYTFEGDEEVQTELINLYRFILDAIGRTYNHSPRLRPDDLNCCRPMPIRWRWSGSAPKRMYIGGGKDLQDLITPLHNLSEPGGSAIARLSWRGAGDLKEDDQNSPYWGKGESWSTFPALIETERAAGIAPTQCRNYYYGEQAGLMPGDTVDAAHILEIIAAAEYLCRHGIWTQQPIKHRVMTPTWQTYGLSCQEWSCRNFGLDEDSELIYMAWAKPGFADCWSDDNTLPKANQPIDPDRVPPAGSCQISYTTGRCVNWTVFNGECFVKPPPYDGECLFHSIGSFLNCQDGWMHYGCQAGGSQYCNVGGECEEEKTKTCSSQEIGFASWVCTPRRCVRGIDSAHGNGDLGIKVRYHDEANFYPRYDVCSRGNCFKDPAYICGLLIDDNGGISDSHDLPLETVKPVVTTPNCGGWLGTDCGIDFEECQADCMGPDSIPDLPGYDDNRRINEDGTYSELCGGWCGGSGIYLTSSWGCGINMSSRCNPELVWAEIDLGINEELDPDDPEYLMPNLAPYTESPDLSLAGCGGRTDAWKKDRLTWCPCLTDTGPVSCANLWCDQELPA